MSLFDLSDLSHAATQVASFHQVQDPPPSFVHRLKTVLDEQSAKIALIERTQREQMAKLEESVRSKQEEVDYLKNQVSELERKWDTLEANVKRVFTNFSELLFGKSNEPAQANPRVEGAEQPAPLPARQTPANLPARRVPVSARRVPAPASSANFRVIKANGKEDPKLAELRQIFKKEKNAAQGIGNKTLVARFSHPIDRAHVKLLCKKLEAEGMIELRGSGSARKWHLLSQPA